MSRPKEMLNCIMHSSLRWSLGMIFFICVLLIPGIYCLAAASGTAPTGDASMPDWVGAVLLTFAALSACMLLPFTITTSTRMNKKTDVFSQEHGVLNCIPCSCLPQSSFALSSIEEVLVDGPGGLEDSSDSDTEPDSEDDGKDDLREFKWKYGNPRMQVMVRTKYDNIPITALTTGGVAKMPCREDSMTAREIKQHLDTFLGFLEDATGDHEAADSSSRSVAQQQQQDDAHAPATSELEFAHRPNVERPRSKHSRRRRSEEELPLVTNPGGRPIVRGSLERAKPPDPSGNIPSITPLATTLSAHPRSYWNNSALTAPTVTSKMEVPSGVSGAARGMNSGVYSISEGPENAGWGDESRDESKLPRPPSQLGFSMEMQGLDDSRHRRHHKKHSDSPPDPEKEARRAAKKAARANETPEERAQRKERKAEKKARKEGRS